MMADTSHSTFLFPLSNHCCALDPVLQQIHSKHSDRCIHKAALAALECALALHWTIRQLESCQAPRSYIHGVGEWGESDEMRRKSDHTKPTSRGYELKHKRQPGILHSIYAGSMGSQTCQAACMKPLIHFHISVDHSCARPFLVCILDCPQHTLTE